MTAAPTLEEVLPEVTENDGNSKPKPPPDVLVVSMYPPGDCPGMLPEKKVWKYVDFRPIVYKIICRFCNLICVYYYMYMI